MLCEQGTETGNEGQRGCDKGREGDGATKGAKGDSATKGMKEMA